MTAATTPRTRLKVCCIASREEAKLAIDAGADALGLVARMPTGPGPIADDLIATIADAVGPPVATFLLTSEVDPDAVIDHVRRTRVNTVQLVDDTVGEDVYAALRKSVPAVRIVQVVHVRDQASVELALRAARLVDSLFGGKIGAPALGVLATAASQRWSAESNLIDAVEHVGRLALLVRADRAGRGEELEEQLFRFGRVLDEEPRLTALLSDYSAPAQGRIALVDKVLSGGGGSVDPTAATLLANTVTLLRGERADEAVMDLAELAVARRGEVVAHVTAAGDLSEQQRNRLTEILSRIYSHPVSVQLNVDPAVLGGLQIEVADEVIDGSISSRLTAARAGLPD
mgnify:CR=1 FL=1